MSISLRIGSPVVVSWFLFFAMFMVLQCLLLFPCHSFAIDDPASELGGVGFSPQLSAKVDLNTEIITEVGQTASLGSLILKNRPAILVPVYYQCPRLCGLVLSGVSNLLRGFGLELGSDFQVIVVSFNPAEGPELAAAQKAQYAKRMQLTPSQAEGLRFVVGNENSIKTLMSQIGFRYQPDGIDFAHSAGIVLLTPKGEISQFFSGIDFPQRDVQLALIEASRGHIGSALDHIVLFCFRFDATKGRYTWAAFNVMRAGGALTLLLFGGLLVTLWRREQRSRRPVHT